MNDTENLKTIDDLKPGDCIVIAKCYDKIKEFHGIYSQDFQCVFFAIPDYYEIIGYKQ